MLLSVVDCPKQEQEKIRKPWSSATDFDSYFYGSVLLITYPVLALHTFSICLCSNAKSSLVYLLLLAWKYHDSYIRSCKYCPVLRITFWLSMYQKVTLHAWSVIIRYLISNRCYNSAIEGPSTTKCNQDSYNCDPSEIYLRAYLLRIILRFDKSWTWFCPGPAEI